MSALTLYDLKGQWLVLANKLSDMDLDAETIGDTLEGSDEQMALEEKVQGYEMVARTLEASVPTIEIEIKRLQALKKAKEARADAVRKRVHEAMTELGLQKITCPLFEIRIQKNTEKLDVFEEKLVPEDYWTTPDKVVDTTKLKADLKAGKEVQGARLTRGESLRIS